MLDFGESVNSKLWELIIACAPHVRKIQGFPLELVDLLPPFPNSGSDEFPSENKLGGNCQMEIIECSLRQVLDIPLKQTNFSIPNYYSLAGRISRAKEDSWYPGNSERFKRTQTSRNLETGIGKTWTSTRDHFFPPRFQMDANVEIGNKSVFTYIMENGPDIKIKCHQRNNEPLFPLDTFGPKILGSGLKNPITRTPSVYKQLVILVQHATHNQLDLHSAMDLSSRIFPECSNGRPLLTSSEDYSRNYQMVYKNLDSVLTRNPAGHCCDIHQKIKRLRKILKAEVSTLQRQNTNKPSLVDMQHLNRLEIILEECRFQCDKCGKKHIFGGMILPWTVLAFQWLLLVDSLTPEGKNALRKKSELVLRAY
ncbi:unnamed protein product [Allacma fusca]|uniref:Uncharacterized protein n=1 Tax=Allacma fusca TaxID=39272 RepID=A0A8J2K1I2_9HEXA|nr:unnamed protein product [Allacma fusca]